LKMNWLEKLAAPLKPAAKSVVETVKKTIKEQPPVQPKPKENYVIPPVAEFVPALKQYQEAENNKGNLVWGQEGFAEQQAERVLTPAVESVGAFIKSGTDAMYNAEMELGKTLYPATKAVYESSIKPFGTYTSAVAAAPFVSAYKSAATVAGGMTDLGASIRETTVDPLARTMTPYYKQVADWTKGQLDRVDWDKFFTGLDVAAETFSKTTSGTFAGGSFDVLTKPANLVGKAAAHLRASEVAEDVKPAINFFETIEKKGLQGAILGAGLYIDILERPVFRKNLLPQLFSNLSLLSKVSSGQGLTEDDIIESKLSAEYMAGGSVNGVSDTSKFLANQLIDILNPFGGGFMNPEEVESYVDYMIGTETRYRAEKLPEITEYVNRKYNNSLTPQEVKQMIESRTIFGLSAQGVLDTVISYSASIAEASLGKVLTNRALGPAANFVGMVMEKAQKMVYPAALGTLALDQAMVSGILGKDKMMGLAKWIDENDLDLQQDVAVLSGIAVLGTAIKGLGKGAKAAGGLFGLNWGQTLKGLDIITKAGEYLEESWKKWAKDPATLKQALDNLQRDWVKTVTDMSPKYTKFTVAEINEMRNLLKSLPPEIQKTFRDVNLTLFMRNLYDGMIAGQAQKATKTISLDMDTFRTKIQGGLWEGDRTLVHEWAHLFEEKIWNDPILGPAWKKLIESKNFTDQGVGKGADYSYKYKNPAEYFAEGVSEYIKTPEVLKMEDPDLFNFMGEVVPQFKRLLDIDFDAFKPAEFMPRLDPLYQEALKYDTPEEFVEVLETKQGFVQQDASTLNSIRHKAHVAKDVSTFSQLAEDQIAEIQRLSNEYYVPVPSGKLEQLSRKADNATPKTLDKIKEDLNDFTEDFTASLDRLYGTEITPTGEARARIGFGTKDPQPFEGVSTAVADSYYWDDASQLTSIWNSAHGGEMMPRAKADASQLLEDIKKAEAAIKEYEQQKLKAPEETVWKDGEPAEVGRKWYDDEIDKEEVYLKEKRGKLINEMVGQWESLWKEWKKAEGQQKEEIKNQMDALSAQIIRQKSAGGPVLNFMPRMDFQEWYDQSPIMGAVRKTVDAAKEVSDYDLANKLITVADPTKLTENGVPKALVPYAVPLRRYATAKEWLTALQENKVRGLPYYDSPIGETQLRLFDHMNKAGGNKYLSAGAFYEAVKKAEWRVDVKWLPEAKAEDVYDLSKKTPYQLEVHATGTQREFMPRARQLGLDSYGLEERQLAEVESIIKDLKLDSYEPETMKQWQQEANEKLATPGWLNNTLQSGRPLSASDGIALRSRLNTDADFILSATKRLPTETDPALLQNKIAAAEDLRERILERLVPGKTEQARALVSNRWIAEKSTDFSFWAQKVKKLLAVPDGLDKGPLYDKYKATLSMLQVLTDQKDMMGIASLVSSLKESDFVDKLVTLWKAGLLTSPLTHIRNMGSNTAFLTLETVKEIPAAMIDKLLSSFTGQRTMGLPNLKTMLSAGVPKGYAMAQEVMKYGGTLEDLGKSDFIKQTVFSDSGLGKAADKYTKFIFRLLGAEDKVFRGVIEAMSVTSQAKAMALNEGLKGKAFQARVSELIDKPTSKMIDLAREQSAYGTFNNKNPISDWIMGGKKTPHAGLRLASEVIMPFTRTPTNVALRGLAYSPAGLAKGVLETLGVILHSVGGDKVPALSQMKAAQDVARGLTGSSIIALGAYLAEKGLMTGTYPSAGEEKKRFKALNLRGGDMIIDGKAVNIMGISPVGNLLQMGASLYNNVKDQGWLKGVVYTTADYGKGLTEQTFLMGLSNALSALSDPTRYGGSVVGGALAGMVPTVIGQLVEAGDQYQREYNGLFSRLQNKVPGWRQSGLPKLDMFGKPMETSQEQFTENIPSNSARYVAKALMRMTDPFFTRDLPEHELLKEYQRLADLGLEKAYPSEPSERGTITYTLKDGSKQKIKYKMQPESYNLYREITGRLMEKAQAELIASAEYQNLSDENKAKALYRVYEDSRDAAKGIVLPLILEEKDVFGSTVYDKLEKDLKAEQVEEIRVLAQAEGAPSWDPEKLIPRSREVTEIVYQ
jgi:hypothetical protein